MAAEDDYHELSAWTLTRGDQAFIHQHVVDAWKAQTADEKSKPIGVVFALAGLYLHVERGLSGKQVQEAHMMMSRSEDPWPRLYLPLGRGEMTVSEVLAAEDRELAIHAWCRSTWEAFHEARPAIVDIVQRTLGPNIRSR